MPYIEKSFENSSYVDSTTIKILLPHDYEMAGEKRYATLYVFDAQWEELLLYIQSVVAYLGSCGYPNFIVVGILTKDRRNMFTPPGSDKLIDFIEFEIMPFVNSSYRTSGMNIAFGHSLSGTFISHCFIKDSSLFHAYLISSPNYINEDWQTEKLLKGRLSGLTSPRLFYIAYGYGDSVEQKFERGVKSVHTLLKEFAPSKLMWKVESLETFPLHGTTPLSGIIKGLEFFHKNAMLEIIPNISLACIKNFYAGHLTEWFGFPVYPDPSQVNSLGYELLWLEKRELSLQVFDWAVELYPDNYNLFDSRGEVNELLLKYENAEADYRNAMRLLRVAFEVKRIDRQVYEQAFSWISERLEKLELKLKPESLK